MELQRQRMRAYQIRDLAHPSKIQVSTDVPDPKPKEGEVLVDVYAAALNFFDLLMMQGKYQDRPPLPFVLGVEFAGRIAKASPIPRGCKFKPGDRVFGSTQGAFAEQAAVSYKSLLPIPTSLSFEQAAAVPVTWTTSYEGIVGRAQAKKGDWVLVHGASGGVGLPACQIAKHLGCKVIAAAGTESKRRICREKAGVDATVDHTTEGWQKEVMRITGGHGVDVVYDPVGLILPSLRCVAWDSRVVVVGFTSGEIEKIPANLLLLKQCSVMGLWWGGTTKRNPRRAATVIKEVMGLLASGSIPPILYERIYEGLEQTPQALLDLEARKVWGKAVIRVRTDKQQAKL